MKKILMVLSPTEFRDIEYIVPKSFFDQAWFEVTTTSTELVSVWRFWLKVQHTWVITDFKWQEFDAIVLVWWKWSLDLETNEDLKEMTNDYLSKWKIVAAICAAPRNLLVWWTARWKEITWNNWDNNFENLALKYWAIPNMQDVVVDQNLVTASWPNVAEEFSNSVINTVNTFTLDKNKKRYLLFFWRRSNPGSHWYPWFKERVEAENNELVIPELPHSSNPTYDEQMAFVDQYKDYLRPGDVILGHSVWCQLVLHFIEKYKLTWLKVFLIAPTYPWIWEWWIGRSVLWDVYESMTEYVNKKINFDKLWNKYIAFMSEDDPMIFIDAAREFYSKLEDVEFVVFKDRWHFSEQTWNFKLEEIFKY